MQRGLCASLSDDDKLPGLARLVEAVHAQGCPIIQQLNHQGPIAGRTLFLTAPQSLFRIGVKVTDASRGR